MDVRPYFFALLALSVAGCADPKFYIEGVTMKRLPGGQVDAMVTIHHDESGAPDLPECVDVTYHVSLATLTADEDAHADAGTAMKESFYANAVEGPGGEGLDVETCFPALGKGETETIDVTSIDPIPSGTTATVQIITQGDCGEDCEDAAATVQTTSP